MKPENLLHEAQLLNLFNSSYYSQSYGFTFKSDIEAFEDFIRKSRYTSLMGAETIFDQDHYWQKFKQEMITNSPIEDYILNFKIRDIADIGPNNPWKPHDHLALNPSDYNSMQFARLAIYLHIYYEDSIDFFVSALTHYPCGFDLFISCRSESALAKAKDKFSQLESVNVMFITKVPNKGRNFRGMLFEFREQLLDYDIIIHMHSKKSLYSGGEQALWFQYLLEFLLIDKQLAHKNLSILTSSPTAGIIFPTPPKRYTPRWVSHSLKNTSSIANFEKLLNCQLFESESNRLFMDYPVGSMFIAKITALRPLLEHKWDESDIPDEPLDNDGTILHAIERCLPRIVEASGFNCIFYDPPSGSWSLDKSYIYSSYHATKSELNIITSRPNSEVISFDIFDTLVSRSTGYNDSAKIIASKTICPSITPEDFLSMRNSVEYNLRTSSTFNGDVSIIEIYDALKNELDISLSSQECSDIEFNADLSILIERKTLTSVLRESYNNGKKIWIITDMYYTSEQISRLLHHFSIPYDRLYVSSNIRMRKDNGTLWKMIKHELDMLNINSHSSFIHIGDNIVSDVQHPSEYGINSYHIMSPVEYSRFRRLSGGSLAYTAAEKLRKMNPAIYSAPLALLTIDTLV